MPGMGWLDRFRRSSGEDLEADEGGDNETESPGAKGKVLNNNRGCAASVKGSTETRRRMPSADMILEYRQISDLTRLDQITLTNVLDCLVERFYSKEYYTFAGSVLISLNPCLKVSRTQFLDVECRTIMSKYLCDFDGGAAEAEKLPPHVYSVGLRSLKSLRTVGNNQVIIVSGDSGAGKTTSTQQLIRYFTETNLEMGSNKTISNLEKRIYFATVVLESFGNASTKANPNSSRFGRLVQLSYDSQSRICGAEIKTYLLEKHRVAKGSCDERNFHIFYFLLKGLEVGRFKIEDISEQWTENYDADLLDYLTEGLRDSDAENMSHFFQALKVLNMTEEFEEIFRIIFAIMQLRTVKFTLQSKEDSDSNSDSEHCSVETKNTEFTVQDWDPVNIACSILGKHKSDLLDACIARKITAGGGNLRRPSIFRKPCERESECDERLQAFIILLYDRLFNFILAKLNYLLQDTPMSKSPIHSTQSHELFQDGDSTERKSIGVPSESHIGTSTNASLSLLDLYGFENLEYNHLEQICINYANERLQQVHISALKNHFEEESNLSEIEIEFEEPLELNRVEAEIRRRIKELHHLFSFLNEECVLKRFSTDKDIFDRMVHETKADEFISCGRLLTEEFPFVVRHYATDVSYHFRGMPDKNKDYIPPEFEELLSSSTNTLIQSLFQQKTSALCQVNSTPNPRTPKSNINERGKTILKRFKSSVDELVKELQEDENQDLHFIRCIRPNKDLQEGKVQLEVVEKQLYSCGIVDVIRIAGNGYPIRIRHSKFGNEFPVTLRYLCDGHLNPKVLSLVFSFDQCPVKVGSSAIFMNEKSWSFIRKFEVFLADSNAKKIQRWIRHLTIIRHQRVQTPSPLPNFGDSISSGETLWYTPMMSPTNSSKMHPIPGPFGDWRSQDDSFNSSLSSMNDTMYIDEDELDQTLMEGRNHEERDEMLSITHDACEGMEEIILNTYVDCCASERKEEIILQPSGAGVSTAPEKLSYFGNGNGIISRAPVHSLPIKFYTKKTALGFFKHPPRLISTGLQDCYTDYEIQMEHNV